MSSHPHAVAVLVAHRVVMTSHRKIIVGAVMIAMLPLAYGANEIASNLYPK